MIGLMNTMFDSISLYRTLSLILVLTISANHCSPESSLTVVYSPDSIVWGQSQPLRSSSIADFLSLSLGYTLPKPIQWGGMASYRNVFELPKVSLTLRIAGHYNLINSINTFPLFQTKHIDSQFDILSQRTDQRFAEKKRFIIKVVLPQEDLNVNEFVGNELLLKYMDINPEQRFLNCLKDMEMNRFISNQNLDANTANVKAFITEIGTIKQILSALKEVKISNENSWPIRSVFWFEMRGLKQIMDDPNYKNVVKEEARQLTINLIDEITQQLRDLYSNKVIITTIEQQEMSPPLVRRTRNLFEDSSEASPGYHNNTVLNLAHSFDANFHTAFAMLAFTAILIAITVFGVSVAMWNIDPGRDSIIYRMTAQRIKKDQ